MRLFPVCAAALMLGAATPCAWAQSNVAITIAGEAYEGAPAFEIRMGDNVVGRGVVDKAIDTQIDGRLFGVSSLTLYLEHFEFEIPDEIFDPSAAVTIVLTNDRYLDVDYGYDRNLFIQQVVVNGSEIAGERIKVIEYGSIEVDVPLHMGLRPLYGGGQVAVATPPTRGWPLLAPEGMDDIALIPMPPPRPSDM